MVAPALPPCGIYRTVAPFGEVPAGRLVYFHNHGDPGPGVYLPERWDHNRAHFSARGHTMPAGLDAAATLTPLPREGMYRVARQFVCCPNRCVDYAPETLVQLGYNGAGKAILFIAELAGGQLSVPTRGNQVEDIALSNLVALLVRQREADPRDDLGTFPRGVIVH